MIVDAGPNVVTTEELWGQVKTLATIYRNEMLAKALAALEQSVPFADESEYFAKLVNTSNSLLEPVSGWARYREAYSPQLVELLLRSFPLASEDCFVLDPMCGSGSSQLAAQGMGYISLGLDVSPYATLLSRVKTAGLSEHDVNRASAWLRELDCSLRETTIGLGDPVDEYLASYFPEANLDSLLRIRSRIEADFRLANGLREFLLVALLAIVEECSNHKKDGNGLARRPSRVENVIELFETQVNLMLSDTAAIGPISVASFTHTETAKRLQHAAADFAEARKLMLGAIVFSPPYPNSFDYFESYKLELLFGRLFDLDTIRSARQDLIRSYRQSGKSNPIAELPSVEMLIDEINERIPLKEAVRGVPDGRSRLLPNLLRGYFGDMQEVMQAAFDAMPSGARMHIVVDQSAYVGVPVPTDLLLGEIGRGLGFEFEQLTLCRRARTSAQQLREFPILGKLIRETVVTLRRP